MYLLVYIPKDDKIQIVLPEKYEKNGSVMKMEHVYGK